MDIFAEKREKTSKIALSYEREFNRACSKHPMSLPNEIDPAAPTQMKAKTRKIFVFVKSSGPQALPQHSASKKFILSVFDLYPSPIRWTDETKTAVRILTDETWRQLKDRTRGVTFSYLYGHVVKCPKLLPTGPHSVGNLDLSYPAKGMETIRHPHEAMRQACLEAKKRLLDEAAQ